MKYVYPVIFTVNDDGSFTVQGADITGAISEGRTLDEALDNAVEVLEMMLASYEDEQLPIPAPSPLEEIKLERNQLVKPVEADTDHYREIVRAIDGNPIRYAREQAGMSIKELADYLDAPYRTVQEWNAGRARPPKWIERILFNHIMDAR